MQEKVLMEGVANPLSPKGLATKNGHGVLTTARFIYNKHSLAKTFIIGILVNVTKGTYEYDIPLEDIASASAGRHMLGHALTITKKDGTVLKYGIMKPKEWQAAFDQAMAGAIEQPQTEETAEQPQMVKRFCPSCGAKLNEGDRFCSGCGAKI